MLGRLLSLKIAAVAGVVVLGATGAAAATGSLPHDAQTVAHDALAKVGVAIPGADDGSNDVVTDPSGTASTTDTTDTTEPSDLTSTPTEPEAEPTVTEPTAPTANPGLCNARERSAGHPAPGSRVGSLTDEDCADVPAPGHSGDHGGDAATTSSPDPQGRDGDADHEGDQHDEGHGTSTSSGSSQGVHGHGDGSDG